MSKFRREEDEADKWLREHDPYYTSSDRDKRKKMSNPYETPEQEKRRRETEIPLSNLNSYLYLEALLRLSRVTRVTL